MYLPTYFLSQYSFLQKDPKCFVKKKCIKAYFNSHILTTSTW
jgi:hypothetical protein